MNDSVDFPVRQSAAIYLKNAIQWDWAERTALEFSIHENDKAYIRETIVDATVMAPEGLRVHLGVCIQSIVRNDFPAQWPNVLDKITSYLRSDNRAVWPGALLALYQLIKRFEFNSEPDRGPLNDAMTHVLPMLYQRSCDLLSDPSDASLLIQKSILKIFYALTHYFMPVKLVTKEVLLKWMEIIKHIIEQPIPPHIDINVDIDDRPEEPCWKCKKWALHIVARVFDRFGSPSTVSAEFKEFATWYIKTFSEGIIASLLKILENHINKVYVAPRVLQQTLNYLNTAVNNAFSWKLLKAHINVIIQEVVFPLLCYTKDDEELWENDPTEYIKLKFDIFEDYVSPVTAAQNLLHTVCKKRRDMLNRTLSFVVNVMSSPQSDARMRDGALHMVGTVADILLKKDMYRDQMENMLVSYVFPNLESPSGYLRARACWVLHYFADTKFNNEANLLKALELIQKCILNETDLPVKVEAAICLQSLITSQEKAKLAAEVQITSIVLELLSVIRKTENEDLTSVLQKFIYKYTDQLIPIALEMTRHMAETFEQLATLSDEENEDRALTAMGLLNTIDTILTMMDEQSELLKDLEPVVISVIERVFTADMIDLYDETFNLVTTLGYNTISPRLWSLFGLIFEVFKKDSTYFTEMMPALHNFITVDPKTFISNQHHVLAIYEMCKTILTSPDSDEDSEAHAVKLMECIIIQFKGQIDQCIHPFLELVVARWTREIKSDDLKTMCLQIFVTALWYNPAILFDSLVKLQPTGSTQPLFDYFLNQWFEDIHMFQGLHDRKVSVLGLVTLLNLPATARPPALATLSHQIVPSALLLFEALKAAYKAKAAADNESESDDDDVEDSDVSDPEDLEDDEDHIPGIETNNSTANSLVRKINGQTPFSVVSVTMDDVDDDDDDDGADDDDDVADQYDLTILESYTTAIDDENDATTDEYVLFRDAMQRLQQEDAAWFSALISPLSEKQRASLEEVYSLAQQRLAAAGLFSLHIFTLFQ